MTAPISGASVPWSFAEAKVFFSCLAAGAVLVMAAWWGSSGRARTDQTGWFVCGIAGVAVLSFGSLAWVMAGHDAVRTRRATLVERLYDLPMCRQEVGDPATVSVLVTLAGSERYHRPDCLLVRGKNVVGVGVVGQAHELRACEMCQP